MDKRRAWSARWANPAFMPEWWVDGPHKFIRQVVETGWLRPCSVLDVGCGAGQQAAWLHQQGFDVVAFDFSPEAIERATKNHPGPTYIVADATENPPSITSKFDAIIDVGCFHGLQEHESYRKNVISWAKPGTRFALVTRCGELQSHQRFQQVRNLFKDSFGLDSCEEMEGSLPRMRDVRMMLFRLIKSPPPEPFLNG